jgi:ketosteroid isomerase-like protein
MRRLAAMLACGWSALCWPLAVSGAMPAASLAADASPGIQGAYDRINAAFDARDFDRFASYFSSDFTAVDPDGKTVTRAETLRQFRERRDRIVTLHSRYVVQSLTPAEDGVMAEMKMHTDGTGRKKVLFATLKGTFTNDLLVRDLWVNTASGWRLKRRQILQDETRIHGL